MTKAILKIQVPKNDTKEKQSRILLGQSLPADRYLESPAGEKYPGYDGYMQIVDNDRVPTGQHFIYQLKSSSNPKQNFYNCHKKYLDLWRDNGIAVILIFANLSTKTLYWEYMSRSYIDNDLQFAGIKKYKKIPFKSTNIIQSGGDFLDTCRQICQDHANLLSEQTKLENERANGSISTDELNQKIQDLSADKRTLSQYTEKPPLQSNTVESAKNELEKIREKFVQSLSKDLGNKFAYYQGFIYLLEPYYIDERGQEVRAKVRSLLSISEVDENLLLQELQKQKLVEQIGGILFAKDKEQAKQITNELLDSNSVEVSELLSIFL